MKKLLQNFDRILQRCVPDPFVIAIFLTALTFLLAVIWGQDGETPIDKAAFQTIVFWGDGFWSLADFTLHMVMILIGGYVVATSKPVRYFLDGCISWIGTPVQAVLFCTIAAMVASWINWGLGLVVGGIVSLEVGKKLPRVPFRVLVASSYSGFLVWHAGLSGSIPLDMNTDGKVFSGLGMELVDTNATLFGPFNLLALAAIFLLLPIVNLFALKMAGDGSKHSFNGLVGDETGAERESQIGDTENWLNRSWVAVIVLFIMAGFYVFALQSDKERSWTWNLNSVNFSFFMLGVVLHGTPRKFVSAVTAAVPKVAPILIQYPLYAGIMAILRDSGLATDISNWFVEHSSATSFPLMTFYSAGLLNLFVPSGGGQWAVQAPVVVTAAQELGVDVPKVAMAVAWGDAWTNLAQPFWAIPLLSIAGLKIKDILGICLVQLIASGIVLSLLLLVV